MKRRVFLPLLLLSALAAGVFFLLRAGPPDSGEARTPRALGVLTAVVEEKDMPRVIDLVGTLEAPQSATLTAQGAGTLRAVKVAEGQAVRAGQVLFEIDARAVDSRLAQSRTALESAQVEIAEAQKQFDRLTPLLAAGYASQKELDDARLVLESARAAGAQAQATLAAARLDREYVSPRAPLSGRAGRITLRPGDVVATGTLLTTVSAIHTLDARASVPQASWPLLAAARREGPVAAELRLDGGSETRSGTLEFVDTRVDVSTGSVAIKVRFANTGETWLPGQPVRIRLLLGKDKLARVIPEAALQLSQGSPFVYVVRAGRAVLQEVSVLRSLDGAVLVDGPLRAGERVLIEVPQRLRAGDKVRLVESTSSGKTEPAARVAP